MWKRNATDVGQRIREELLRLGWSQADLARRLNVSTMVLSNWIRSESLGIDKIKAVAEACGVSVAFLLREDSDEGMYGGDL